MLVALTVGGIYIIPGSVLGEAAPFWTMAKVKEQRWNQAMLFKLLLGCGT